jgi:hypothetical protein
MKSRHLILLLILASGLLGISCKKDATSDAARAKEMQDDALKNLESSFEKIKEGNNEVVDFRILKDALPDKLVGMDRVSHNGNKTSFAGVAISTAEAEYADGDRKMAINIIDTGGFGAVMAGMAAWSNIEIDNESDDGYERTTLIDGKKAFEKYNRKTKEGGINVISADRFIVMVNAKNISEEDLRKALEKIKV